MRRYGGCNKHVYQTWGEACSVGGNPGGTWKTGTWKLDTRKSTGKAVQAENPLLGLGSIVVTLRSIDNPDVILASTTSNLSGNFTIVRPDDRDEWALYANGTAVGRGQGFVTCANTLVPDWLDACSKGGFSFGSIKLALD